MSVSDKVRGLIESALKLENDGIEFYRTASNKTLHPLGKAMFASFISEEKKHIAKLNKMFTKGASQCKPEPLEPGCPLERLKDVFKKTYKDGDVMVNPNTDDLKAIRTAIDFEKDGSKIYDEAVAASSVPSHQHEKEIFEFLAKEEKNHLIVLENMLKEMEKAYKQDARNEQRTQVEWERNLFMRPDAQAKKID